MRLAMCVAVVCVGGAACQKPDYGGHGPGAAPGSHIVEPPTAEAIAKNDALREAREKREGHVYTPQQNQPSRVGDVVTTTAREITAVYADNPIAGDGRFGGKTVVMGGTVRLIGRDTDGRPYLAFVERARGAACYFERGEDALVRDVHKGQEVYVVGRCIGISDDIVKLAGCHLR